METKNLQQKLLAVREAIPAMQKQNHNDDAGYDFTKIDDIYKYLTPAMNLEGVNMDVVAETATRRDSNGNPVYVSRIPESNLWIYEADLTIVWTNTDNPEEKDTVILHAIGTNEAPDKAKGSAWTYMLKYYFFTKFAINQGADDPDAKNLFPKDDRKAKSGQNPSPNSVGEKEPSQEASFQRTLTLEEARRVVCEIGMNKGKTLGEIADGDKGFQFIQWYVHSYHGKDDRLRKAAGLILQSMMDEEQDAA